MPDEKTEAAPSGGWNWKSNLAAGIIALIVAFAGGMAIQYFNTSTRSLEYDILLSEPFKGDMADVAIAALRIYNTGDLEVKELSCDIDFGEAIIVDQKITGLPETAFDYTFSDLSPKKSAPSAIRVTAPLFNPTEVISIQMLVNQESKDLKQPTVAVRGVGVVGAIKTDLRLSNSWRWTIVLLSVVGSAALALIIHRLTQILSHRDSLIDMLSAENLRQRSEMAKMTHKYLSQETNPPEDR